MRKLDLFCLFVILLLVSNQINAQTTRKALFLGNSYTYVNDLPELIKNVAQSVGDKLIYDDNTIGGYTLLDHYGDTNSTNKIKNSNWDYIILQGQSQEPITKTGKFKSGAKALNNIANEYNSCSVTMLYVTWGRKNGDADNCAKYPVMCTYLGMDTSIRNEYYDLATTTNAEVSPVSVVWRYLRSNNPNINLYQSDGSHPSKAGSYAAACCFYTTIFKKDPTLITYNFGLSTTEAAIIRNAVKTQVYNNLSSWNFKQLPTSDFSYRIGAGQNEVVVWPKYSPAVEKYHWDFGDGATSTLSNASHSYSSDGTYKITLTASSCDLQGVHTSITDTIIQFCGHTPTIYTKNAWVCNIDTLLTQSVDAYQWFSDGKYIPETAKSIPNYRKHGDASYTVLATKNGCSELSREFAKTPDWSGYYFDMKQTGDPCNGDTVWFTTLHKNGSLSGLEYIYWYKNDTLLSSLTNMDTMHITGPGIYKCGVVDPTSKCPIDTTFSSNIEFDCNTSIAIKKIKKLNWSFYPNPVNETITIKLPNSYLTVKLQIFSLTGQLLKTEEVDNNRTIYVDDLQSGVYFLKLAKYPNSTLRLVKM